MLEDTIIAVATPPGFGGLGIVRISGRQALAVARRIFEPTGGRKKPIPVRRRLKPAGRIACFIVILHCSGTRRLKSADILRIFPIFSLG